MSTAKTTPKKLTRTRRRTKLDKVLAGEAPIKQKNIRVTRHPGAAPLKKARDIIAETPKKKPKNRKPQYIVRDDYFYEAKKLGYRARSAFKLLEIQEKYNIIRPGMKVLDIASAPGSWLQVLAKMVGPTGVIAGIDIQKIKGLGYPNVHVFQGDVFVTEPIIAFLK
jgi:23S rRNA (uridine2552-2'-O)-methyltransferase